MFGKELELFQRSERSIWTDEYISKELLKCHLDESTEGASRSSEKREQILNFISENIKPNSKILDLGCGPGLLDFELGKLDHKILGVDFNIESISYANKNKKLDNIEYLYENYLTQDFDGKYDVILMIYCDFGALIPSEQKIILKKIYNLLSDNGVFIFDVFETSNKSKPTCNCKKWNFSKGNDFWNKEPYLILEEVKIFKNENAVGNRYFVIDQKNGTKKEFILWNQYYDKASISNFLLKDKFKVKNIKLDLLGKNDVMFLVAEKR